MEGKSCNHENDGKKYFNDSSRVWGLIEGRARTRGEVREQFSLRNIPEDRYDEALDFLCDYYIPDEPICRSMQVKNDRVAIEDFRREWRYFIEQGVSVGVFLLDTNLIKSPMVGVNVLYIGTREKEAVEMQKITFNSRKAEKMVEMFHRVQNEVDIYGKYETESYIGAIGLSVHPRYRGHGLAKYILDARTQIGRELGIPVTVTNFTGPLSQLAAERAGFELLLEKRYDEMLDDNGKIMFPVEQSKTIKLMGKRLY